MSDKIIIHQGDQSVYVVEEMEHAIIIIPVKAGEQTVTIRLVGQGASAQIVGVGYLKANEQAKLHTLQHHEARETTSNLLVRAVLSDTASFTYDGAIYVEKAAQKTNAYQRNENLLLSDQAYAQSKPSLEILANDVRCTHGATISTIDPEQLFFLESRGIDQQNGEKLIVHGFLNSIFSTIEDTIEVQKVKENIWQNMSKQLQ